MEPAKLKYAKTHEWVSVDGDVATVGITDFAVKQLTDLVHIELPRLGARFSPAQPFGEVESVKAVSDLYAPVAGEVIEVNKALAGDLAALSDDPYDKGWIIKLRMADKEALARLMDRAAYEAHCASEEH